MFWCFAYHCKKIYIDLVCGCLKQWKFLETFQRSESESTRSKVGWLSKERLFMCSFYSYKRWYIICVVLGCLEKQILITSYVCTTYSVLPHKTQSAAIISHQNPFFRYFTRKIVLKVRLNIGTNNIEAKHLSATDQVFDFLQNLHDDTMEFFLHFSS